MIAGDTVEAICELTAYKLMEARKQPEHAKAILENPYTHGKIKDLVALEKERGIGLRFELGENRNDHDF